MTARKPSRRRDESNGHKRRAATAGPELDPFESSIVRSKVQPPPVRLQTLARARLLDWLTDHSVDRLRLIIAEAGYGKTTLLADFSRREIVRCLWYKLDTSDRDWVTFINYLVASVREVVPDFGQRTTSLLRQLAVMDPPRDVVLGSFLSELGAVTEPTLLILDDFQLVDESTDVQAIVGHILERAPSAFAVIISSRRRPLLRLGKLKAQGEVATLNTEDLRFSQPETEELFRAIYGQPLEADLLSQIDARTEGWPASLQLLYSSIRERGPGEIRAFILEMSGATGSLYDFLAEEAVGHLSTDVARFVTLAAILERIVPAFAAALYGPAEAPSISEIRSWLDEVEDLGLLGRSSATSVSRRFHPLLREFLQRRLADGVTRVEQEQMHLRVAMVAEPLDWLTACHHFIQAGAPQDAMRVLNDSAADALGTGSWGAASELIPLMEGVDAPPAVQVLRARDLVDDHPQEALMVLDGLAPEMPARVTALVRHTRASALLRVGDFRAVLACVNEILGDPETPAALEEIAQGYVFMLTDGKAEAVKYLGDLAARQARAGQYFHGAISYHNAMLCEINRGKYREARNLGAAALEQFKLVGIRRREVSSTQAMMALCSAELGHEDEALEELGRAMDQQSEADADALSDAASILAVMGRPERASELQDEADKRHRDGMQGLGAGSVAVQARAVLCVVAGRPRDALQILEQTPGDYDPDVGSAAGRAAWAAIAAAAAGLADAGDRADDGLALCVAQEAWRYAARLAIVKAAHEGDSKALGLAVRQAAKMGMLALLDTADVLARSLHLFSTLPGPIEQSMTRFPQRWLPGIRAALNDGNVASARAAARVLATRGSAADIPRLVAYETTYSRGHRHEQLGRHLARRVSPRLRVRDLGRIRYEVGSRRVEVTQTRRRAASLLALLITRPQRTATKDQVMEELWPELKPDAASNSLNQTLYFLRRDIDQYYDEKTSADYIVYESELLWLDSELVRTESVEFLSATSSAFDSGKGLADRTAVLSRYGGKFAPEFEYEEWSMSWREQLHASYLHLARSIELELIAEGALEQSAAIAGGVLALDGHAIEFQRDLVWLYSRLGALDAAHGQYALYSQTMRNEFGLDSSPYDEVVATPPGRSV